VPLEQQKKILWPFFFTEEVLITFIGGLLGILWTIFGGLFLHYAGDIAILHFL